MARPVAREDDSHYTLTSWLVLAGVALLLGLAFAQTLYRLSLPWDGWSLARDGTGTGQRLAFYQNLAAGASPLRSGDILLMAQGQPYDEMLARGLTMQPERPPTWTEGGTSRYTVLRDGQVIALTIPLIRLTRSQVLGRIGNTLINDPSLLPALLIALFVFFKRPRSTAARLLLIVSASFFASTGISQGVTGSNVLGVAELFYRDAYWPTQLFNLLIWPFVIGPAYVQLFISFPVPKYPVVRYPRLTVAVLYGLMPVLTIIALVLTAGQPLAFWQTWSVVNFLDFCMCLLVAISSTVHTLFTAETPTHQAQIRWVAWGALITSIGALSGGVLASLGLVEANWVISFVAYRLLFLGVPLSMAIAILRYRLFDIDVIIRRTLIYGVLSGALALVYFVSVIVLQQLFQDVTGQLESGLATVLSTLAIAALFIPLRQRVQQAIDRRFYRSKYDMALTLAEFGGIMRNEVDLNALAEHLLTVVDSAVKPAHVSLWLKPLDNAARKENEAG